MKKIHYLSLSLRLFFQASFGILALAFIVSWIAVSIGYTKLQNPWSHFAVSFFITSMHLLILFFLIKLFRSYEKNVLFSLKNVNMIRNIGYVLLTKQVILSIWHCFSAGYWTGFNMNSIEIMILALLIIVNSWIMTEAYKLRQEQELTI